MEEVLAGGKGTPDDRARLLLVLLLSSKQQPPPDALDRLVGAVGAGGAQGEGVDARAAVDFVRRMVGMNLAGAGQHRREESAGAGAGGAEGSLGQLTGWAERALGQGLNRVRAGVRGLLQGARTTAVAAAVDALMEGKKGVGTGEGGGVVEGKKDVVFMSA